MPRSLSGKNSWLFALSLLFSLSAFAQETDEQMAAYYYREGSYDKAQLYYEKLYEEAEGDEYYGFLLDCYLRQEHYTDAEKLAVRHAKARPVSIHYQVDVGYVQKKAGEDAKAEKTFDKVLKAIPDASNQQILDVATAFHDRGEIRRALDVYYALRKREKDDYPLHFQIAPLLGELNDIDGMVGEYLDVLLVSPRYLTSVQNTLNRLIGFDTDNTYNHVLEQQLLERTQKYPDAFVYAEMLIWMYEQQMRFGPALIHVKALEKRQKSDGQHVMSLADLALSNRQFDVAIEAYEFVRAKGPGTRYYASASNGLLNALYQKSTSTSYDKASIDKLCRAYRETLKEFGLNSAVTNTIRDFAHVKAYYESRYQPRAVAQAIDTLESALNQGGFAAHDRAELKLKLGDIYILANRIWDASLLFGQVEKEFKYDEIGHLAKLKNAKVFYYSGDFGWAEIQLKVLKGSTSKLISNDALELSAFISENTGLDTTTEALALFAHTELLVAQHKFDSALWQLEEIERRFPFHELSDNLIYERAIIYEEQAHYAEAVEQYLKVHSRYGSDILGDNALYRAAVLCEEQLHDEEQAKALFQQLLVEYTGSLFVVDARKRYRNLRGDSVQ